MISLILYGRNDNHGYNLHKRAAISLNAMAQVLGEPDDEILFVDYNTPDDLPTFVEAIGDTLSPRARECVRILRVRPALHERFRDKTHLLALESVSRNVALRRANPRNRWVLSTNTDMIFTPHDVNASLTDIVRDLDDGFYQLPRFELPESLWESFDRRDGAGIVSRTRELAVRFHLNEVVYGSDAVLFDGPGDFQLCLRDDLVQIHGFHEGMLRGWHVDANLCARMISLRGEIKSLAGALYAYHCDHTRQATSTHKHDRVENDAEVFVDPRGDPHIPEQAETWGLPEAPIEEIRLGRGDIFARYVRGLERAIPSPQSEVYDSAYRGESFGETTYRIAHVLPFVLDLLAAYPAGAKVLYAGARADMGAAITSALSAMVAGMDVVAPSEFPWLRSLAGAKSMSVDAALSDADIAVFEFGAGEPGVPVDREMKARLTSVRRALMSFVGVEKSRIANGAAPRRVLAINAIHNEYESLVSGVMSYTLTPFSTHVRHGFVLAERAATATEGFDVRSVWRDVQRTLGRTRSLPQSETKELAAMVAELGAAPADAPIASTILVSAEPLMAVLRHDDVERACQIPRPRALALADRLELERPGVAVRRLLQPHYARARIPLQAALSRVADMSDWERERFAEFVDRHFGGPNASAYPDRNPWTWERAATLDALAEEGVLASESRVLLVTTVPDAMAPALADYVQVSLARARSGETAFIAPCSASDRDPHGHEQGQTLWQPGDRGFDALIFLQQSIMRRGPRGVGQAMNEAAQLVRPGGLVLMSAGVALSGPAAGSEFRAQPLADGTFSKDLRGAGAALEFCGPLEASLTRVTCDRIVDHAREDLRYRRFVTMRGRGVAGEALLAFRGVSEGRPLGDRMLEKVIDVGTSGDIRYQAGRVVRLMERVERRLRWEVDRRRGPGRRR